MNEYGPREDHLALQVLMSMSWKYFCHRNNDFSIFLRVFPSGHGRLFLCRPVRIIWIFRDELRLYIHIPTVAHFSDFRAHSPIRTHPDTGPHPRLCMVCIFELVFVLILFSEKFLEIRLSSWMRVKWPLSDFWQFCPSLEHMGFGLPFVNSKLWRFRGKMSIQIKLMISIFLKSSGFQRRKWHICDDFSQTPRGNSAFLF